MSHSKSSSWWVMTQPWQIRSVSLKSGGEGNYSVILPWPGFFFLLGLWVEAVLNYQMLFVDERKGLKRSHAVPGVAVNVAICWGLQPCNDVSCPWCLWEPSPRRPSDLHDQSVGHTPPWELAEFYPCWSHSEDQPWASQTQRCEHTLGAGSTVFSLPGVAGDWRQSPEEPQTRWGSFSPRIVADCVAVLLFFSTCLLVFKFL